MKIKVLLKSVMATAVSSAFMLQPMLFHVSAIEKNAEVNEANVLELLNEYDKDGEYIIQFGINDGDNILEWFNHGTTIIDDISTAVHEETHGFILQKRRVEEEEIYIGNKNSIHVTYTDVFDSQEMVSEIPDELQTFRFDDYVGKPDPDMASNKEGVYGLLNEFTAYCWDLNNTICLYDYYKSEANTDSDWLDYVNKLQNGRMAYSEFNFYILKYLEYAQKKHPDIYEKIITNKSFTEAYTTIENKYHDLVETGDMYINELLNEKNGKIENGFFYLGSAGISISDEDYTKLITEISKNDYQVIYKAIGGMNSTTSGNIATSTNTSIGISGTKISSTTTPTTIYSHSGTISSIGNGKAEETPWFSVSNCVLVIMWIFSLLGVIIIVTELIKARKKK